MPSNEGAGVSHRIDPFKVLVIGGSYGGLATSLNLWDLCNGRSARFNAALENEPNDVKIPVEITVVDEKDGYFHLISAPLALASNCYAPKAWTKFGDIPALKNIHFIKGSAKGIDMKRKCATICESMTNSESEVPYDFCVAASGLRRAWPVVPQSTTRELYLEETAAHVNAVKAARDGVVVIGGGAVGIEMAAEIKLMMPEQKVTLIHSREQLCSAEPLPNEFKDKCLVSLGEAGVETIMGQRVLEVEKTQNELGESISRLMLSNGSVVFASEVIRAISKSTPSTSYLPGTVLDEAGYVKVAPSLHILSDNQNSQCHFAVGDIAKWSGIRRCGTAMHMGQYAAQNIHKLMLRSIQGAEPKFMELDDIPPMMGIAIGRQAVAYHPSTGVTHGEKVLETLFRDDLGNTICWDYMQLGNTFP